MTTIKLGDKVKDTVTGFTGIAVGKTTWLHGCTRITVQPIGVDKAGKLFQAESFDEPQLKVMTPKKAKTGSRKTGGPRDNVYQKPTPVR